MQFHLNRPSRRARYVLPHAHTDCHDARTRPADASTAGRPSPRVAVEPQPGSGALAGAAAGPAGRAAIETPYAAKAALSDAPGIGAGPPAEPNDPAAWGYAARSPTAGKIWRTTPALPSRYVGRKAPFQHAKYANSSREALNLFHSVQTKSCLGHCITRGLGLRRQATILRLRGAALFSRGKAGPARGNSNARAGLERLYSADKRARQLTS